MKKIFVSCFDIGEVPRSPGKWNWNWLYFLPFIFTFEQGEAFAYLVVMVDLFLLVQRYASSQMNWLRTDYVSTVL